MILTLTRDTRYHVVQGKKHTENIIILKNILYSVHIFRPTSASCVALPFVRLHSLRRTVCPEIIMGRKRFAARFAAVSPGTLCL